MMTFQNGEVYCGAWLRDLRHGEGVHTFVDGSRYEGQWENDALHGKGIFYYSDGSVFAGQFDSNKRHGPGAGVLSFAPLSCVVVSACDLSQAASRLKTATRTKLFSPCSAFFSCGDTCSVTKEHGKTMQNAVTGSFPT
jgi:hypothetical protein